MAQSLKNLREPAKTNEENEQIEDFKPDEASSERLQNDEHKFTDPVHHNHGKDIGKVKTSFDGELKKGLFVYTFEKLSIVLYQS